MRPSVLRRITFLTRWRARRRHRPRARRRCIPRLSRLCHRRAWPSLGQLTRLKNQRKSEREQAVMRSLPWRRPGLRRAAPKPLARKSANQLAASRTAHRARTIACPRPTARLRMPRGRPSLTMVPREAMMTLAHKALHTALQQTRRADARHGNSSQETICGTAERETQVQKSRTQSEQQQDTHTHTHTHTNACAHTHTETKMSSYYD